MLEIEFWHAILFIIVALSAYLLRRPNTRHAFYRRFKTLKRFRPFAWLGRVYEGIRAFWNRTRKWRNRIISITVAVVIIVLIFMMAGQVDSELMPRTP